MTFARTKVTRLNPLSAPRIQIQVTMSRFMVVCAIACALVVSTSAAAQLREPVEDGRVCSPPSEWVSVGRSDPNSAIRLTIAVKHAKGSAKQLEEVLLKVSDPTDEVNYGTVAGVGGSCRAGTVF